MKAVGDSQDGYYGFYSRKIISEALAAHPEIFDWKKQVFMEKLSQDGYFWFKTKRQKLDYIHRNIQTNSLLKIVADAENVHSWTVNETEASEVPLEVSKALQSAFYKEAQSDYQEWQLFREYTNSYLGLHPEKRTGKVALTIKGCWNKFHLDKLYNYYWPYLKSNRNLSDFTQAEQHSLDKMDRLLVAWADKPVKDIGFFGNSPYDDVLMFVPVEKIAALAGRAGLRVIKSVGSKLAERGIAVGGAKVIGRGVELIREVPLKLSTRLIVRIKYNWARLFGKSGISEFDWELAENVIGGRIQAIYQWLDKQKLEGARDRLAGMAQKIVDGIEVISQKEMTRRGHKPAAAYCRTDKCEIVIKDTVLPRYGTNQKAFESIVDHEVSHAASAIHDSYRALYWFTDRTGNRYVPLEEGINEFLSRVRMNNPATYGAYQAEVEVAMELQNLLHHVRGPAEGARLLNQAFYQEGLKSLDTFARRPGMHDKLQSYLVKGDTRGAIMYLRSLY